MNMEQVREVMKLYIGEHNIADPKTAISMVALALMHVADEVDRLQKIIDDRDQNQGSD